MWCGLCSDDWRRFFVIRLFNDSEQIFRSIKFGKWKHFGFIGYHRWEGLYQHINFGIISITNCWTITSEALILINDHTVVSTVYFLKNSSPVPKQFLHPKLIHFFASVIASNIDVRFDVILACENNVHFIKDMYTLRNLP